MILKRKRRSLSWSSLLKYRFVEVSISAIYSLVAPTPKGYGISFIYSIELFYNYKDGRPSLLTAVFRG